MRFGSVCSGIEAASVAWATLGWKASFFSEIEAFPSAVLAERHPDVPNRGDMTKFKDWPDDAIDLLVGGTPCQSFSVAGLRTGLADPRGSLMLTYLAIAAKYRPRWLVWENVPGVLSSNDGRDFGSLLGGLGQLRYGFAYRVLDAQFCRASGLPFAVPQRRRRVFVVGYLGDWRRAAAVLFDGASLRGDSAPRRQAGQGFAADVAPSLVSSGRGVERTGETRGQDPLVAEVAQTLTRGAESAGKGGYAGRRQEDDSNLVAAFKGGQGSKAHGIGYDENVAPTLGSAPSGSNLSPTLMQGWAARHLTPRECERLQGFPDDYTLITHRGKPAADGPRYKALGNSMAVNVMRVLGERIALVDAIQVERVAA